jgi:hypothetical protein
MCAGSARSRSVVEGLLLVSATDYLVKLTNQGRQVAADDSPEYVEIDLIVTMDQAIAQSNDFRPGNTQVSPSIRLRHAASGFSQYLQESA